MIAKVLYILYKVLLLLEKGYVFNIIKKSYGKKSHEITRKEKL